MSLLPVLAGLGFFALSLLLFRVRRGPAGTPSIWRQGGVAARLALVAWWVALALVAAGLGMAVRG